MIVLLDALDKPKSERALRLCMEWQPLLEEMGVPAYIVSSSDTRLYSIPYFQLCSDLDCHLHRRFGAIRSKVIYGKSRDCIQGTIVVMQDKDVVQINHRVNDKSAKQYGGLAQLGEHLPYKQRVSGSSPLTSTI